MTWTSARPSQRDAAHRKPSDAGLTLIELAVVCSILGLFVIALTSLHIATQRSAARAMAKDLSTRGLLVVSEAFSRPARMAVAPVLASGAQNPDVAVRLASPTTVEFYAAMNSATGSTADLPMLYQYDYVADTRCVRMRRTQGVVSATGVSWPAANTQSTCLVRTSTAPTYRYYRRAASGELQPVALTGQSAIIGQYNGADAAQRAAADSLRSVVALEIDGAFDETTSAMRQPSSLKLRIEMINATLGRQGAIR